MSIILKENEWAENMIKSKTLGSKPTETLRRVSRYYLDKGYGKKETRSLLDSFLIACEPTSSLTRWSDTLDGILNKASKYEAVSIDNIEISKTEMEKINALDGVQIRRLAFTLLCIAKYQLKINPDSNGWVNCKGNEIMSMANVNTSLKRQCLMYRKLKEQGLVQFSKRVDNTNIRVCFIDDGEPVIKILDFRNLGYQYLKYHGEPFFECENCGLVTKIISPNKGRKQKYCRECAVVVNTQQKVNSVMKRRKADF